MKLITKINIGIIIMPWAVLITGCSTPPSTVTYSSTTLLTPVVPSAVVTTTTTTYRTNNNSYCMGQSYYYTQTYCPNGWNVVNNSGCYIKRYTCRQ